MSATIRRDNIVDLVIGNRRPFALHLDLVMVTAHAILGRATVHEVTARAFAVVSVQVWVKLHMPPIVACPVISFLRHSAHTEKHGHHADYRYPCRNFRSHKGLPQQNNKTPRRRLVPTISEVWVVIQGCMNGIPEATPIRLTEEERAELLSLARSTKTEYRMRQRARIVCIRLSKELYRRLREEATVAECSLKAEMLSRLQASFGNDRSHPQA
jgi:hypothetical protein